MVTQTLAAVIMIPLALANFYFGYWLRGHQEKKYRERYMDWPLTELEEKDTT